MAPPVQSLLACSRCSRVLSLLPRHFGNVLFLGLGRRHALERGVRVPLGVCLEVQEAACGRGRERSAVCEWSRGSPPDREKNGDTKPASKKKALARRFLIAEKAAPCPLLDATAATNDDAGAVVRERSFAAGRKNAFEQ